MATPELSFATPAELLAALPHLLGFVPANDLVVLMLGPADHPLHIPMRLAIRCPVTIDDERVQRFPSTCSLTAAHYPGACLVAVCDPHHDEHAVAVLRTMRSALDERGIVVHRMLTTHSVSEADHWSDPDTGEHGPTIPYTDSPATALGVFDGRIIAASHEHMQREFTPIEPAPPLDVEAQDIAALIACTATDLHRAITGHGEPAPELASRAALLVTAPTGLRDGLLRLALGHELAAGRLWTHIAAQHRGRTRVELLTMAAIAYYAGEDTVRAGMALTRAGEATRDDDSALPHLTALIFVALQAGVPPTKIREVIPTREKTPIPGTDL